MNTKRTTHFFHRITASLLACLLAVAGPAGCGKKEETTESDSIKVETTSAEYGTLEIHTDYIASLSPNLTVDVIPLVAGTVKRLRVKVGDRVKAGDLLCQLDDTSAELSVKSARDAVNSARAGKDAAETQSDTAKIQADANVKTLKKTLNAYQRSLKTAENQLNKLQASRRNIKKSHAASQKTYADAKKRYKTAQRLQVQFETFLNENPDCKTTAGLTTAATMLTDSLAPGTGTGTDTAVPGGTEAGTLPGTGTGSGTGDQSGTTPTAGNSGSGQGMDEAARKKEEAKQKQAQALLAALTDAGLTVEYLTPNGIKMLADDVADLENIYKGSNSGLSQIDSGITTLKTNISQLKTQIDTTKESLASAQKLARAASAGTEVYDAQIEAAKTGVEAARYQKDLYRLTAPINGIVDAVNVKKKGMATQGIAAFTISEKSSMIATFYVTEDVKNYLVLGDTVTLLSDEGEAENKGHITSIGTAADPQKSLFKVEAEFVTTGQKKLSSGTSIRVSLISNAVSGELIIPYDSVYYDDGQAYVYRVSDGKASRADVETGLYNQDQIIVTSGLTAGDSIITTWASGLKDGAEVEDVTGMEDGSTDSADGEDGSPTDEEGATKADGEDGP